MKTFKNIFDYHFQDVNFDNNFKREVEDFVRQFLSKNSDHVEFFGGNLLGVNPVRWNYSDTDRWWDDIFNVVEEYVKDDLMKHPEIKANRIVSSDSLNHAFIYALHRVHHSTQIAEKDKDLLKTRIMLAMNMKFICSLMAHYFRYPALRGVAEKTFNRLTKRFDLKIHGSWGRMLLNRSADFISPNGRYYKAYVNYDDDIEIIKMINDAQGRIRDSVKAVTKEYYDTLEEGSRVLSSSSSVDLDGSVMLKDVFRKMTEYNRYVKNVLTTRDSYIKEDIQSLIYKAIPSLDGMVYDELTFTLLDNFLESKHKNALNSLVDNVLTFSLNFIKDNDIAEKDLSGVIYRLKHVFMSGRITDQTLINARKDFEKLVVIWDKSKKNSPMVPERCAIFLYLVVRTLTKDLYK